MSNILVTSSMQASTSLATYTVKSTHKKNETSSQAINIGNLQEESATIKVSDKGQAAQSAVSTTFTALDGVASLSTEFANFVEASATHFQLYDNQGNVIADNQGTTAQQAAYSQWKAGTLVISEGTYTAIATPNQAFSTALTINKQELQGTSLQVSSRLTGNDTTEYYNFSLSGNNMKMDFDAGTNGNSARVQILDSNGKVIADSMGNAYQKSRYIAMTSATGITTNSGNYTAKISYAPRADNTKDVKYSMQLYSGNSYAAVYKNTVKAQDYDGSATGSVTATTDAKLYGATSYNKIGATAADAITIGWLQQDKSSLDVFSQLTPADNAEYYAFTLQKGDNLKFGFISSKSTADASTFRVQLMDMTGTYVIADNAGTDAQRAAYKKLTTAKGMDSKPGSYVVKISYAANAAKKNATYEFGIFSGTTYAAKYKTTASAQTVANALLSGNLKGGTTASSAIASYLTTMSNTSDPSTLTTLTDALKSAV